MTYEDRFKIKLELDTLPCSCTKDVIGGYAGCPQHDPRLQKYRELPEAPKKPVVEYGTGQAQWE